MDSLPAVALWLLYTRVVVIRGRTSALVPRRFLKDAHVTITVFTLLDGEALRVLRRPISNPDQVEGLILVRSAVTRHRVKNRSMQVLVYANLGCFYISCSQQRGICVGAIWKLVPDQWRWRPGQTASCYASRLRLHRQLCLLS